MPLTQNKAHFNEVVYGSAFLSVLTRSWSKFLYDEQRSIAVIISSQSAVAEGEGELLLE